ncbi:HAD family phosphatase [Falsirhodobacter sp. alg1]|uniref:HAD family hydrolase n=1 Tax=Falsirhodobacter sp. alg1 TaxID=1472418 RepID=UPI0005EF9B7B|nr:HAD-IA family hydrolase [Falsirhodobacter sp. alg1]
MVKAVIFDCDGVLVDSEAATFHALARNLAAHGLTMSIPDLEEQFLGGTIHEVYDGARRMGADLPADWVADFYAALYTELRQHTPKIEGIEAVLDRLDAAGIPYGVGSNGSGEKMAITLGQHPGLWSRLEGRLFSGQDMNMPKPDPGLYLHVASFLGHAPQDCIVVEDSLTGARAARLAGIRCLGFAPDGSKHLEAEGAESFHDMADLPGLLGL